ncbi:hypothetical protein D3C80_1891760 [compost metagenome]
MAEHALLERAESTLAERGLQEQAEDKLVEREQLERTDRQEAGPAEAEEISSGMV